MATQFDFKTATPDTSFPANGFLFGADSQSATDPSIYSHTAYLNYILSLANTWTATQTFSGAITGASNVIEQRSTTNAQTFRVYNTWTDASNYERGLVGWTGSAFVVASENSGTGSARELVLNGANGLRLQAGGGTAGLISTTAVNLYKNVLFGTDNFYDIGASGATRPRNIYVGTSVFAGGDVTANGSVTASSGSVVATAGNVVLRNGTAIPAGGTTGAGFKFWSTSNFGVFGGSGAPTLSAAQGSLYLRSDGTGTSDRAYINTDGGTTWTALTTAA